MAARPVIHISVCEDDAAEAQKKAEVNSSTVQSPNGGSSPITARDALYNVVRRGSLKEVREVLTSTAINRTDRYKMVDYSDEHGRTPLHLAAQDGKVRIVLLMLEHDSFIINKQVRY